MPTGTVTCLFTDIVGSTALWELHPEAARVALARHDALVEQIVAVHDGHVVRPRGEGDSRFVVFARATDAVAAAAALQQTFAVEPWPTSTPLRMRMALHTGEADLHQGDYYGTAVNRCARLRAVASGGRTLLSQATYDLVGDHSLPGLGPDHRFGPRGRDDCHTLRGRETGGQPLVASLKAYLRTKQLLLVLDNFEHVVAAAPLVGDLLNPQTCSYEQGLGGQPASHPCAMFLPASGYENPVQGPHHRSLQTSRTSPAGPGASLRMHRALLP